VVGVELRLARSRSSARHRSLALGLRILRRVFEARPVLRSTVALVALAHLKHFAGDKPLQPLLRALKLETRLEFRDNLLLFHLLHSFDYIGSSSPAAEAYRLRSEAELASEQAEKLYIDDYTHKLEQPNITLNSLYSHECSSKHKGNLASGITEVVPKVEYPARPVHRLPAHLGSF
jgi:hypothetical protein